MLSSSFDPQAFFYRENLNEDERMLSISPYRLYQGEIKEALQLVIMAEKNSRASRRLTCG